MSRKAWTVSDLICYLQEIAGESDPPIYLVSPVNNKEPLDHRNIESLLQINEDFQLEIYVE